MSGQFFNLSNATQTCTSHLRLDGATDDGQGEPFESIAVAGPDKSLPTVGTVPLGIQG